MTPTISARSSRSARLVLTLIVIVASLAAASTWRVYSHTWDEPEHLAAGIELLDRGQYEYDIEHPPIARALIALGPYLAGARSYGTPPPSGVQEGIDILYGTGHYNLYLTLARLGALPFLALLLVASWLWARRVAHSDNEASLAIMLLASVPPVLGHAALATLDVPGAATTLVALYLFQHWLTSGRPRDAALFGVAAGIAMETKLFAIPFIALGMLVLFTAHALLKSRDAICRQRNPIGQQVQLGRRLAGMLLMTVALALPIAIAYGRHAIKLTSEPPRFNGALSHLVSGSGWEYATLCAGASHVRLPAALWDFVLGISVLKAHNDSGHVSFLLGSLRSDGWWYFYLVALAAKTPIPLLLTGPMGMALMARDGWRERNSWRLAPAVLFVTLLAFASLYSHINIGIRHVLILYPFMALGGAYALWLGWRRVALLRSSVGMAVGVCVIVGLVWWQVSALWTINPDYLPYFNEAVDHPERVLVDSDLDWGQDLRRLEWRLAALKVPHLSFAYIGTADLAREPLPPTVLLEPLQRATGWVAITALAREHAPLGYSWLADYKPVQRVGKTIDLYYIP